MLTQPPALIRLLLVAGACLLLFGCAEEAPPPEVEETPPAKVEEARIEETKMEEAPPVEPSPEPESPPNFPEPPPPQPGEVAGAVDRVFKGVVTPDTNRESWYLVGDFNGDLSQDLAVVVKPVAEQVSAINDELASWILVAPIQAYSERAPYDVHAQAARRRRPVVHARDLLVAVIHGYEGQGWRDPLATQTYVLKDVAGEKMMKTDRKKVVRPRGAPMPHLRGDVIAEIVGGRSGFVYYNGAKYEWYDPQTYTPPAPTRGMHSGMARMRQ
jgi:hypothetical protein